MSAVSIQQRGFVDVLSLADLLNPMQFKTVLLAASGLQNCEISMCLGTTELVIEHALADAYYRTSCSDSGEVVRRYCREVSSGLLELGRLQRELAELESRIGQNLYARLGDLLHPVN
jgi:DNA-binding CsgD family transcriptional regulator